MSEVPATLTEDDDLDELPGFALEPVESISLCPYCQLPVGDSGYWVIENLTDDHYTGYCNQLHHDVHNHIGLWEEPPPLKLEDI